MGVMNRFTKISFAILFVLLSAQPIVSRADEVSDLQGQIDLIKQDLEKKTESVDNTMGEIKKIEQSQASISQKII